MSICAEFFIFASSCQRGESYVLADTDFENKEDGLLCSVPIAESVYT